LFWWVWQGTGRQLETTVKNDETTQKN